MANRARRQSHFADVALFYCPRAGSRVWEPNVLAVVSQLALNATNAEIKSLAKDDKTHPLIVGSRVFDVLPTTRDLIDFTRKQYLFLQLLWRGLSTEEAADKSGMELEQALSFRDGEKARDYMQKKELASIVAQEARNPDRWWVEVHNVMDGTKVLNKGQMVALQAQGDRVAPKRDEVNAEKSKVVINFNFSAESVQEAFKRQRSIDAQLVEELGD